MKRFITMAVSLVLVAALVSYAQYQAPTSNPAIVVNTCGTVPSDWPTAGQRAPQTVDTTGVTCTSAGGGGGGAVTIADGADVTQGAKANARSTATDTTAITIMQVLKEISFMEQNPASRAVTNAGTFATQSAITAASGSIASGAIASGAVASGAFASGALASGSVASGAFASGSIASGAIVSGADVSEGATTVDRCTTTDTTACTVVGLLKQNNFLMGTPTGVTTAANANSQVRAYQTLASGVISTAMTITTQSTQVISGTGSNYIYVTACRVSNGSTTVSTDVILQDGSGGTTIDIIPAPAASVATTGGSGAIVGYGDHPLKVPTVSNGLFANTVTTGASVKVSCNGFKSTVSY